MYSKIIDKAREELEYYEASGLKNIKRERWAGWETQMRANERFYGGEFRMPKSPSLITQLMKDALLREGSLNAEQIDAEIFNLLDVGKRTRTTDKSLVAVNEDIEADKQAKRLLKSLNTKCEPRDSETPTITFDYLDLKK